MVDQINIFVITGLSGAGKSVVLKTFEDAGFFCIDNLPISLLPSFFTCIEQAKFPARKIALGIDIRSGMDLSIADQLIQLKQQELFTLKIIFLTAQLSTLMKRFQETRRTHPLQTSQDSTCELSVALEHEKKALGLVEQIADYNIDTNDLTLPQLRTLIRTLLGTSTTIPPITVMLSSFGFKHGTPIEHNFIFDVRSLPNPHFIESLRTFDGRSTEIQEYLFSQQSVISYWEKFFDFLYMSLEHIRKEGRYFIYIGIGCTGGKHRSVAFVEKVAQTQLNNVHFFIKHRDIDKDTATQW